MRFAIRVLVFAAFALAAHSGGAAERSAAGASRSAPAAADHGRFQPGALAMLPDDGRAIYLEAFAAARAEIRIGICVLFDQEILEGLRRALDRGVRLRVIVDGGRYAALPEEREQLAVQLTAAGAQLHLSNPIFPRSFAKVILIDDRYAVVGSACLDPTTFAQYRDYAYVSASRGLVRGLARLFENDWRHSAAPGAPFPTYNPTPATTRSDLVVAPVDATYRLVRFFRTARTSLDVTTELLGNPTLESELAAAAAAGVRVRLIAPETVNGASAAEQALQTASLRALKAAGVQVHVTRQPESPDTPYMHARTAVADGRRAYLGSISLSPDSTTRNREVGLIREDRRLARLLQRQFDLDFAAKSQPY